MVLWGRELEQVASAERRKCMARHDSIEEIGAAVRQSRAAIEESRRMLSLLGQLDRRASRPAVCATRR